MLHGSLFRVSRLHMFAGAVVLMALAYYNLSLSALTAILFFALYHRSRERHKAQQQAFAAYVESLSFHIDQAGLYALHHLPMAIIVFDEAGKVHWRNQLGADWLDRNFCAGDDIGQVCPELAMIRNWEKSQTRIIVSGERYLQITCKPTEVGESGEKRLFTAYISDVSASECTRLKSQAAMPVFAYIQIDNLSDVLKGLSETQRSGIIAAVNTKLAEWASETDSYIKRFAEDMYLAIFNRQSLDKILNDKFDILDRIRAIQGGNKIPVTLSIGVSAEEESILLLGQKAQAGLDLALGRGGDQAAVYANGKMQFYGGKAKAVEKNTRVKARVVSQAIHELIEDAELVLIMGHAHEDFDSLGSAIGLAVMARHLEKPTYIVLSQPGSAVDKLSELLADYEEYRTIFISPAQAASILKEANSDKTLLFVSDTHRPDLTAAPELLTEVEKVIVIDHHRRAEDFITSPLLVYLEPSASSTSELVTELLTYFDDNIDMNRLEASALYAGIVVDTKNFAVQTGVRTFEAASYLRRIGADPRLVRQLFRVDLESLRHRAEIIGNATQLPGGIIVAECPSGVKNIQMVAAQAADMLLNLEGVQVSFVLFAADDMINISARSQGDVNVQVLMESFGGGGHQTMAGAQLKNITMEEVRQRLVELVQKQIEESEADETHSATRSERSR
ncbi:MAG: diguanylate cyclase and phosphoesterase [Anaerosporomusa subterranea]|nr:diguanylate cyclase and phosphoesterase [Anaerosporomusa subterranea]